MVHGQTIIQDLDHCVQLFAVSCCCSSSSTRTLPFFSRLDITVAQWMLRKFCLRLLSAYIVTSASSPATSLWLTWELQGESQCYSVSIYHVCLSVSLSALVWCNNYAFSWPWMTTHQALVLWPVVKYRSISVRWREMVHSLLLSSFLSLLLYTATGESAVCSRA